MGRLESDIAHIRSDISDIKSDIRELRAESSSHNEALGRVRVERLHQLIIRTSLTDRIWMLTLTGTMLAVMAHGFKGI